MIFFQVGTVAAARQAVRDGADAVVCQGVDAGGHQFVGGAGVVSLVVEVGDMLEAKGGREVVVVAAGGIVDGRGVAAALALGELFLCCACLLLRLCVPGLLFFFFAPVGVEKGRDADGWIGAEAVVMGTRVGLLACSFGLPVVVLT